MFTRDRLNILLSQLNLLLTLVFCFCKSVCIVSSSLQLIFTMFPCLCESFSIIIILFNYLSSINFVIICSQTLQSMFWLKFKDIVSHPYRPIDYNFIYYEYNFRHESLRPNNVVFWDITQYNLICRYQRFEEIFQLLLQDRRDYI